MVTFLTLSRHFLASSPGIIASLLAHFGSGSTHSHPLNLKAAKLFSKVSDKAHPKLCALCGEVDLKLKPIFSIPFKDVSKMSYTYAVSPNFSGFYALLQGIFFCL